MSSKKLASNLHKSLGLVESLKHISAPDDLKEKAEDFLRNGLTGHSIEEVRRAYNGLITAQIILGPVHRDFRNSLESARKSLADFQKVVTKRDVWWEVCREELAPQMEKNRDIFRKYATPEVWAQVGPMFEELVARLRREWKA